ncbi:MAG TPA: serine/threonine-protein kinase [Fimbriimonadaceae bacterium]|nr:serine/threonine-protein kinase [Fimbriimonadaceae bacterium]
MAETLALPIGTVLCGRFEVQRVLGRGGFSIAYLATDLSRGDACVVKELAPSGALRRESGELDLGSIANAHPARLKERFLKEAELVGGLNVPGVLPLREAFADLGSAYFATDYIQGSRTLDSVLAQDGRLDVDYVLGIFYQLLDTLQALHERKILHRDLKPTNILVSPKDEAFLIDFGAAREWHADHAVQHTVMFTPGYAPIEQLSELGKRGPATDIYALCATMYHLLAGYPPRSATDRASGTAMTSLSRIRPDLDRPLLEAIDAGLALEFSARPQSIAELRKLLSANDQGSKPMSLEAFDAIAVKLKEFRFSRRECPACGGLLESPKPLRRNACPVCQEGFLKKRLLEERLCPTCRSGALHHRVGSPLLYCPHCRKGPVEAHRKTLLHRKARVHCSDCGTTLEGDEIDGSLTACPDPSFWDRHRGTEPWERWIEISGRSGEAMLCDECGAQYDILPAGRWREPTRAGTPREYYPDEWARLARGLAPDAGNAYCETCDSDFWLDERSLTLLHARTDPHGYSDAYLDVPVALEEVPWKAAGKSSGASGLVCGVCRTEFDVEKEALLLQATRNPRLERHKGEPHTLEEWHRIAEGLPLREQEAQFERDFLAALRTAFHTRRLSPEPRHPEILWRGKAALLRLEDSEPAPGEANETALYGMIMEGPMVVDDREITLGKLLKKHRWALSEVEEVAADQDILRFVWRGESVLLQIAPTEIRARTDSGERRLKLSAEDLASGLRHLLGS